MKQFRSRRSNLSIYTTITASLPFIEANLKLKPSQMSMLVNGLKYIIPCQSRFSRTSIDQILTEQYQSISTTIENCLRDHGIPITNQSIRESFQKLQTNLHKLKSNKMPKFQQKRAQYEYRIVQSIQHVLRHRSDIVIRRTDKSKVFYIGKATDFIQKAADYMIKTEAYQEVTSGHCPLLKIFNAVQHLLQNLMRTRALTTKQCNRISPKLDSLELGHYHGLPKPHKVNGFLFTSTIVSLLCLLSIA